MDRIYPTTRMKLILPLLTCLSLTACPGPNEPTSNVCQCGGEYGQYDKAVDGRMGMMKQTRYCTKCGKSQTREFYQTK